MIYINLVKFQSLGRFLSGSPGALVLCGLDWSPQIARLN